MPNGNLDINEIRKSRDSFETWLIMTLQNGKERMGRIEDRLDSIEESAADTREFAATINANGCARSGEHEALSEKHEALAGRVGTLEKKSVWGKAIETVTAALAGLLGGGIGGSLH